MSHEQIAATDRAVLDLLREHGSLSVTELVEKIEVTATAVRQRLNRLLAGNLIDRVELHKQRGRPSFLYRLTEAGRQTAGDNFADFADVLWEQILDIPDPQLKKQMMSGVARRLAEKYSDQVNGKSTNERIKAVAELLAQRNIPLSLDEAGGQPVLKVHGCPYPQLAEKDTSICELEKQLFEILFDSPVDVDRCQCGEGIAHCCSFQPVSIGSSPSLNE